MVSISKAALVAISCAAFTACSWPGGVSGTPAGAPASAAAMRPHWTKTSIGTFTDPYGVAVDADGNAYVADPGSKIVWKITPKGARRELGNDWAGATGNKFDPVGISIAGGGYVVYVADKGTGTVWGVATNNGIAKIKGGFPWPHYPRGVAYVTSSSVAYADIATATPLSTRGSVRCISTACPVLTVRELNNPYGVAADDRGNVYVADAGAKEVLRIDAAGVTSIGRFADPYGVAVRPDGTKVYVADAGAKKVYEGTPDGSSWTEIGTFGDPYGVAVSAQGDVYVADPGTKDVWKLTP